MNTHSITHSKPNMISQIVVFVLVALGVLYASEHNFNLTTVVYTSIIFIGSYALAYIIDKKRKVEVLAYILGGIAVVNIAFFTGQLSFVEFFQKSHYWHTIGEIVLGFLFLKLGLETNVSIIPQVGVRAILLAILGMVFVGAAGYIGLLPFQFSGIQLAFIIVALVPTSAGVPMITMNGKGMGKALVATFILVAAIADDILSLVLLTVLDGAKAGNVDVIVLLQKVGTTMAFLLIGSAIGYLANKRFLYKLFHKLGSETSVLIVTLIWGAIFGITAYLLGVSVVIGTYTAGLFLAKATYDEGKKHVELEHIVDPWVKILAPIFFVWVGGQFLISNITGNALLLAVIMLAALTIGKYLSAKAATIGAKEHIKKMTFGLMFGMFARVEVALIIVAMAISSGVLSQDQITALILMVLFSVIISIVGLSKWVDKNQSWEPY